MIAPARTHIDDRRSMWADIFPPEVREVNVCAIVSGASAGSWHGHVRQDDYWFVAAGLLRVGTKSSTAQDCRLMRPSDLLHIPAGVWHTYKALEPTVLVYGLTNRWDGSDEGRLAYTATERELYG